MEVLARRASRLIPGWVARRTKVCFEPDSAIVILCCERAQREKCGMSEKLRAAVPLEIYFNDTGDQMFVTTAMKPGYLHIFDISEGVTSPKLLKSIETADGAHHVGFTPDSGHSSVQVGCPLCAKNRRSSAVATQTLYLHCGSILVEARAMATGLGSVPGALNSERSVAV